jgi:uncharacterized protein (DUF362 family)
MAPSAPTTSAPSAASSTTLAQQAPGTSPGGPGGHPAVDLAVYTGDDPARNVRSAVEALGGMGRFVRRGARVVIKPNVLTGAAPEYAVTTNPQVVGALIALCFEAGAAEVTVFDNPTSPARSSYAESGIAQAVSAAGGRLKYLTDRNFESVAIPQGRLLTSWPLVTDVFDADVFINVPIAKQHGMAGLSLSMKNLMGIMGGTRAVVHVDFDQKIVDLNTLVRPHLVVLDAYRILTRHGPTGGDLGDVKQTRTVVVGTNQASVDAYGTTLFGMQPTDLAYLRRAGEQGLGEVEVSKLRIARGKA